LSYFSGKNVPTDIKQHHLLLTRCNMILCFVIHISKYQRVASKNPLNFSV
jgi:hypothetical protein